MEENKPIISFILTYYNLPIQMLCECINSILALSLLPSEREIIVIDDGSETSPMNGLMQYGDDIIYIRQKNQGLSMARNKGIEMAQGTYLQFVDADDHLILAPYEHCLDIIQKNGDIDMLMFDFANTQSTNKTYSDSEVMTGSEYMLNHNIHATACGYLFKRTTLSELRFTPGIWHEDEEFTPQLLIRAEHVCVTDAKAYYYYRHKGSITTHDNEESKAKRFDDIKGVLDRLHYLCDRVPQVDRLALQRRVAQLTMDYIYQVIVQQRSQKALNACIDKLRSKGLFPLPDRDYSQKYIWFRKMTNTRLGRTILLNTLPLLKKER
ncbi:MAG: glycosyltransferase [Prevotella sp.]|nr:glycosyltransferase [Prevotella sp.]